jgi:hypothetical protein
LHQHQQDQPGDRTHDLRQSMNLLVGASQAVSSMLCPWLHRPGTAGARFYGLHAFIGWLFIPVFGGLGHPKKSLTLLLAFWGATTVLLLVNSIRGFILRRRGYWQHSRYTGRPWIPGPEYLVKCLIEPPLVIGLGVLVMQFDLPLGAYLTLAGVCLAINMAWQYLADDSRVRAQRDAQAEMEQLGEWLGDDR